MNWLVFIVVAWAALGVQWGFAKALELGQSQIAPYIPFVLMTWVALSAPPLHALGGAIVIGMLYDIYAHVPSSAGGTIVVLGPNALGCALGAYLVLTLRGVMLQKNLMTIVILAGLLALLCQLLATTLLSLRGVVDSLAAASGGERVLFGSPLAELGVRSASAVYTGVVAAAIGPLLELIRPLFSFSTPGGPGFRGR